MGVLIAPIFVYSQITIECLINEEISAPDCYDCTNASDTALFTGFRITHSGVDTTMIEAPWRLKVRRSTDEFIFFDYRDQVKFSHIDSVGAFATLDDLIEYVKDCQSFEVVYGNGDSTRTMHWRDTMFINYPEGGGGAGPGDTSYVWWYEVDGNTPARDSVTFGEGINFVAGTNMSITQGATNLTFNNTMSDTACVYALQQLTDSTARLVDCHGVNRGEVEFIGTVPAPVDSDSCRQSFIFLNDTTLLLSDCDGVTGKDTAIFRGGGTADTYLDSSFYANDTVTYFRFDKNGGVVDSFKMELIINDSIVPDTQSLAITDDSLHISRGNAVDLSPYLDNDTIYQQLSKSNDTIFLENGGFVLDYNDTIYQNIIKDGIAVTLSHVNDTIADLQERGVVYWKNGEWASDSAWIQYHDGAKQLLINRGDTTGSVPYRIVAKGSLYLQNDQNYGDETKLTFEDRTGDRWNIQVNERKFVIQPPNASSGDAVFSIDSNTVGKKFQIFQEGVGVNIGNNVPQYELHVFGDIYSQGGYYVDGTGSTGSGDNWVVSRDTLRTRYKPIIGRNGIQINASYDSIYIDGSGATEGVFSNGSPWHIPYFDGDSTIRTLSSWDSLVLMNDSQRWIYFNDPLSSLAIGKGSQAHNSLNTALGAYAFPYVAYASGETVSNSQVDTTNEVFTGLSSFITTLTDSGYVVGQNITIDVQLNSGEMPFIDSAVYMPTGLIVFEIASTSTLRPVYFELDSAATGSYEFTANKYLDHSTSIGALSVVTKPHQIALGDSSLAELKIGDSIWIKADTFYQENEMMIFDSDLGQIRPIGLDSLNALLNIIASGPQQIDTMYISGDTLYLKLEHTDQKFVVLPQGVDTFFVNEDSLFINDEYVLLPQGADSLGRNGTPGQIVFETATKAPNSDPGLFWNNSTKQFGVGTSTPATAVKMQLEGASQVEFAINALVGNPDFLLSENGNTRAQIKYDRTANGLSFNINDSYASGIEGLFGAEVVVYYDGGAIKHNSYGSGTFDAALTYVSGYDGSGNIKERTLADFAGDLSGSLGTSVAATQVPYGNGTGTALTSEAAFTYIAGDNQLHLDDGNILISGPSTTYTAVKINASENSGEAYFDFYRESDGAAGRQLVFRRGGTEIFELAGDIIIHDELNLNGNYILDSDGDTPGSVGMGLYWDGTDMNWEYSTLNRLSDVSASSPTVGYVLGWNGSTWSPTPASGYSFDVASLDDATSGTISSGNTLTFDGTNGSTFSYNSGTKRMTLSIPDGSATNEIQSIAQGTRTSNTVPITISPGGSGATLTTFTSTLAGVVPASGGGTTNFLRADGNWSAAPGADGNGIFNGASNGQIGNTTHDMTAIISSGRFFAIDRLSGTDEFYIGSNTNLYSDGQINITSTTNTNITSVDEDVSISSGAGSGDHIFLTPNGTDGNVKFELGTHDIYTIRNGSVGAGFGNGTAFGDGTTEGISFAGGTTNEVALVVNGTGELTVGVNQVEINAGTTGTYTLEVNGTASRTGGTTWANESDRRLKREIKTIEDPYKSISALRPVSFRFKDSYLESRNVKDKTYIGYIAQEYQKVFPDDVSTDDETGILSISPDAVVPYSVAAIQQLIRDNQELRQRIEKLEKLIK